jgi:thiamine pyrophosphate-dependent acetolactate synthase large subunit-like protein
MTGVSQRRCGVVETLAAHGVDTVFGIPSTDNLEICRHLPTTGMCPR